MNIKNHTWREVKDARIILIGKKCEECGRHLCRRQIIGHHILPRKEMDRIGAYLVELCDLRCMTCERMLHRKYEDGNPPRLKDRVAVVMWNNGVFD